jgi:hypothetical protein
VQVIDDGEHLKRSTISERIVNEVHAPSLSRPGRHRRRPPVQANHFEGKRIERWEVGACVMSTQAFAEGASGVFTAC